MRRNWQGLFDGLVPNNAYLKGQHCQLSYLNNRPIPMLRPRRGDGRPESRHRNDHFLGFFPPLFHLCHLSVPLSSVYYRVATAAWWKQTSQSQLLKFTPTVFYSRRGRSDRPALQNQTGRRRRRERRPRSLASKERDGLVILRLILKYARFHSLFQS